ncbi:MAG TPA: hypothetical protein VNG33_14950 [Polyangiaceae bacterium]|nr:hypothetical protein [Polyangiaceae bacterium]
MTIPEAEQFSRCRFRPWVGQNYSGGFRGCRLLLLGESHYSAKPLEHEANTTTRVIEKFALSATPLPFFSRVARLCSGQRAETPEARSAFWNSVSFYNYVQELAGTGPRQRPTKAMWEGGEAPFEQVLTALRPTAILILGKQLAVEMVKPRLRFPLGTINGVEVLARLHCIAIGGDVPAITVSHPSSGRLKYATWEPRVALLFEHARRLADSALDDGQRSFDVPKH